MSETLSSDDAARAGVSLPLILDTTRTEGPDGMPARRLFTPDGSRPFDPFLYFVHFGPRQLHETNWGFPAHPHKGFETITYMLQGELEHRDSAGGHAVMRPGDVQWVTAGAGILHSEIPPDAFMRTGGIVDGFQIWLNLARDDKAAPGGYQMLRADETPVAKPAKGVTLRVIGGAAEDQQSPVAMRTPISLIHARLEPGARWQHEANVGHNPFVYVIEGGCQIAIGGGDAEAGEGQTAILGLSPGMMTVSASPERGADLLYLAGTPIEEPIASYGPFVMTSREEIVEAIDEYKSGRMGVL